MPSSIPARLLSPVPIDAGRGSDVSDFPKIFRLFGLQKVLAVALLESLEDLAHALRAVARRDQQRVRRIHHDEVLNPEQRDNLAASVDEIILRVEDYGIVDDHVASTVAREQFVDGVPASYVIP